MKRLYHILSRTLLVLLLLLLTLWVVVQTPAFQNWLAKTAAKRLSAKLGTTVSIGSANIVLFNHLKLNQLLVADLQKDSLLYAGELRVDITDWFFNSDTAALNHVLLKDTKINLKRSDRVWNYQFLVDQFTGGKKKERKNAFKIGLKVLDIENLQLRQMDDWRGRALVASVGNLHLEASKFDLESRQIALDVLTLDAPEYREFRTYGLWTAADSTRYAANQRAVYLADSSKPKTTVPTQSFNVWAKLVTLKNGLVEIYNRPKVPSHPNEFDSRDIILSAITGSMKNLSLAGADTIMGQVDLSAKERSGIHLKKLHANFTMHPQMMEFADLDLQLNDSKLGSYFAMRYNSIADMAQFIDSVHITANLKNSVIYIPDIGFFAPLLFSRKQTIDLSGNALGTIANFTIKNLDLKTGQTRLTGNYSMKGLTDVENTIINWQTAGSSIGLADLAVWAPQLTNLRKTPLYNLGVVNFAGSYQGTPSNFNTKGHIKTNAGSLDVDFSLAMTGAKQGYAARITNAKLNGEKLLKISKLGTIDFDGTISSNGFGQANPLLVDGKIRNATYNGYSYQNMMVSGKLAKDVLTATLIVSDDNLAGNFETQIDFNTNAPRYNGRGILSRANLKALGFSKENLGFSGEFDVDFSGKRIDEFLGFARFYNAKLLLGEKRLSFDSLVVRSSIDENRMKTLSLNTNEADAKLEGRFNIAELGNSFQYFLSHYYPSLIPKPKNTAKNQDFTFAVTTKFIEPFLALIDSNLHGFNYADISGKLNTEQSLLTIKAEVQQAGYDNVQLNQLNLTGNGSLEKLDLAGSIENVQVNDSLSFPKAEFAIRTNRDTTRVLLSTASQGALGDARLNAIVVNNPRGFDLSFNESSFIVNRKKWTIAQNGSLSLRDKYIISDGISLSTEGQEAKLYTVPSEEGNWNDILVNVKGFNLGDFLPYLLSNPRLEGEATGTVTISDPLGKINVSTKLGLSKFRFNNDSIGQVDVQGQYNMASKKLNATIGSNNPDYEFGGNIALDLNDSAEVQINTNIPLKRTRIKVLSQYLTSVFDEIDGYASGNLRLVGKLNAPRLLGKVQLSGGSILVNYTKCRYNLDTATLNFGYNFIDLGKITISDREQRKGSIEGIFYHSFFDSLSFNLKMRSQGMEVLNTTSKDNSLFYGKAVTSASLDLNGPLSRLNMRIAGTTTDSSHIFINTKSSRQSADADFIVFKTYGTAIEPVRSGQAVNIITDIDLTANNLCKIDVILDELTGDVMKATGNGNLKVHTGSFEPTQMRGRFNVEKGIYDYRFQTLIRKPFVMLPDGNNFIEWNGNPYDANLNINAVYEARNVSLSSLVGNSGNNTLLDANAQSYTGNVLVVANIKGKLTKPSIDFEIAFPAGSSMGNNLSVQEMMRRIKDDGTEKLRQVTYLIVFKSFAPYKEGTSSRNPGTDLAVNTITDLLSTEMGKILSDVVHRITGNYALNVDVSTNFYSSSQLVGGNVVAASSYDRVKVDLNLSQSFFNNRLVLNAGSDLDVNVRSSAVTGFQFLPDISAEFILTPNRRLRFIIFKRDNLDFAGRRNRAGVSISYRKDYETLFGSQENALFMTRSKPKAPVALPTSKQ